MLSTIAATLLCTLPAAAPAQAGSEAWVLASRLNARAKPAATAQVQLQLKIGEAVVRQRTEGDWTFVTRPQLPGRGGWVMAALLSPTPVTMASVLKAWKGELFGEAADRLKWAERAMAIDEEDPRAMAVYVESLESEPERLAKLLKVIDRRYARWMAHGFEAQGFEAQDFEAQGFEAQGFEAQGFEAQASALQQLCPAGCGPRLEEEVRKKPLSDLTDEVVRGDEPRFAIHTRPDHPGVRRAFIRSLGARIALPLSPITAATTRALYKRHIAPAAEGLYGSLSEVQQTTGRDLLQGLADRQFDTRFPKQPKLETVGAALAATAVYRDAKPKRLLGFWQRRLAEGNARLVALALEKLLVLYDPYALLRVGPLKRDHGPWIPDTRSNAISITALGNYADRAGTPFTDGWLLDAAVLKPARSVGTEGEIGNAIDAVVEGEAVARRQGIFLTGPFTAGPLQSVVLAKTHQGFEARWGEQKLKLVTLQSEQTPYPVGCPEMLDEYQEPAIDEDPSLEPVTPAEDIPTRTTEHYQVELGGSSLGVLGPVSHETPGDGFFLVGDVNRDGLPDFITRGAESDDNSVDRQLHLSRANKLTKHTFSAGMPCGC